MKWGVRRYQNPDGSLTGAGQKRYSAAVKSTIKPVTKHKLYGVALKKKADENLNKLDYDIWHRNNAGQANFARMTNCKLSELDNHKEVIKSGKKLFRVGFLDDIPANSKDVENIAKKTMLYVSQSRDDHARYLGLFTNEFQGGAKRISLVYETKNRIVAPSERQRMITFMTLMNNNPEFRKAVTNTPVSEGKKNLRENYSQFVQTIGRGGKARDIYFDTLRKRGFNAVADDLDRGTISKTSIILLNPEKDIKLKKAKEITDRQLLRIAANMKTLE